MDGNLLDEMKESMAGRDGVDAASGAAQSAADPIEAVQPSPWDSKEGDNVDVDMDDPFGELVVRSSVAPVNQDAAPEAEPVQDDAPGADVQSIASAIVSAVEEVETDAEAGPDADASMTTAVQDMSDAMHCGTGAIDTLLLNVADMDEAMESSMDDSMIADARHSFDQLEADSPTTLAVNDTGLGDWHTDALMSQEPYADDVSVLLTEEDPALGIDFSG